jgi:hypothetical protein
MTARALRAGGTRGVGRLGERDRIPIRIGDLHVADTVRVGLDRFVLDALGSEALKERVEPSDGEGDPARARPRRVRLDKEPARSSISQRISSPTRLSGGGPKKRAYQSMLASRSDTGTPAKRWVIARMSEGHGHVKNGCGHGVSFPGLQFY